MKYFKRLLLTGILSTGVIFCGFAFKQQSIDIDTDKYKVYKEYSADEILNGEAEENNGLCCITGTVEEISDNKKKVYISNGKSDKRICLTTDAVVKQVEQISAAENIRAYGVAKKNIFKKNEYYIDVSSISKGENLLQSEDLYYLEDGYGINKNEMSERTLNDGKIKYYIPKSWTSEEVELNIKENELGYVDGFQYVLNKIPGSDENTPESFFVCYFKYDGNLQKTTSRKKAKPIEKAIVASIEDSTNLKNPSLDKKTYYGAKYQYYQGQYNDSIQVNEDYYTEYIFEQNGEDGLVLYLYVFKKPTHIDDIMFVTRFLEIN